MSRFVLAIIAGFIFLTGNMINAVPHVPLRQSFTVVPRGTEVMVTITESASGSISATIEDDVVIDGDAVIHRGSRLLGQITKNKTEFTLLDHQPVLLVPSSSVTAKAEEPTLIAGSILIGAVVGHQINLRRPEVGALMGGISGLAKAAEKSSEMVPAVGDRIPLLIQRDLTVRI